MKNLNLIFAVIWLVGIAFICGTYYQLSKENYKHQVLLPQVCDEYLTVKKSDVPIACYEYFGIK